MAISIFRFSSASGRLRPQTPYQDFALDLTGDFCARPLTFVKSFVLKLYYGQLLHVHPLVL